MKYRQFMEEHYIPYYRTTVEHSTFSVREKNLLQLCDRFGDTTLRSITLEQVQMFRTWLLTSQDEGGAGYSQGYASLIFGMFSKSLDYALQMGYVEKNISKQSNAIPKGKSNIPYWTKSEFEAVISQIYIEDVYEHLNFVMIWVYFMTGVRVNEGCALQWNDVDFDKQRLRVHHMLIVKNKNSKQAEPANS